MDDPESALAYARADFAEVNSAFVDRILELFPLEGETRILDIGTGPADIPIRLADRISEARITAVDASAPMLELAAEAAAQAGFSERIDLVEALVPDLPLDPGFDLVISNSLLHHLPDPLDFWREIRQQGRPGAGFLAMDLIRPASETDAHDVVEKHAATEHSQLKADFFNSLLSAFTVEEINEQLRQTGFHDARAAQVSDRHWQAHGRL